jgi:cyclopropane fatty-acyl-phospholipid synthase-like methyltransferase
MGTVRALRILHRAFGRYPAAHRLHILIRFATCPFLRTLDDVPRDARLLEIGSGHGLFACLAIEDRGCEVVGVDPDLRKSLLPSPSPNFHKVAGYDDCIQGEFDAVAIYDVAYRLSVDAQRALFSRAFSLLRPGGVLLCKEMDPAHPMKMKWTHFQEWLSDTFLGITVGSGIVYQTREAMEVMLRDLGFTDFRARPVDRGYLHPHLLYTARRPL